MPLSIMLNAKIYDYKFKKQNDFTYAFYLSRDEDILIGQIFKMRKSWSAVSRKPHRMNGISGFKTRIDAAEYLLKLNKYTK